MKNALLFSTALILASASMCFAAEQRTVSGVVRSIDAQARIITLEDDTSYPLKADADVTWLKPGNNVDLLCDYDTDVIDCGIGIADTPEEAHNATPAPSELDPDLGVDDEPVDGLPEDVLPDQPTYSLKTLLRPLDQK